MKKRKLIKYILIEIIFMIAIIFILVMIQISHADGNTNVTVALDYTPNTNHTGLYVAKDKGYYDDAGLNVDIIQPSDGTAEQMVASGKADFGVSYEENLLQAVDKGLPLKAIYAIQAHNTSGFISKGEENITRPRDFENKTYCGLGSDVEEQLVKHLMEEDGGDPDKVTIQDTGGDIFKSDSSCDFFWVFDGWDVVKADMVNIDYNYISLEDENIDWYTPIIITSDELIEKNSKVVQDFVNATQKGYQFSIENPDESADILLKYAPELDKDLILNSQKKVSSFYKDDSLELGFFDPEIYEKFADYLKKENIIKSDVDVGKTYTNEYIN